MERLTEKDYKAMIVAEMKVIGVNVKLRSNGIPIQYVPVLTDKENSNLAYKNICDNVNYLTEKYVATKTEQEVFKTEAYRLFELDNFEEKKQMEYKLAFLETKFNQQQEKSFSQ